MNSVSVNLYNYFNNDIFYTTLHGMLMNFKLN